MPLAQATLVQTKTPATVYTCRQILTRRMHLPGIVLKPGTEGSPPILLDITVSDLPCADGIACLVRFAVLGLPTLVTTNLWFDGQLVDRQESYYRAYAHAIVGVILPPGTAEIDLARFWITLTGSGA